MEDAPAVGSLLCFNLSLDSPILLIFSISVLRLATDKTVGDALG